MLSMHVHYLVTFNSFYGIVFLKCKKDASKHFNTLHQNTKISAQFSMTAQYTGAVVTFCEYSGLDTDYWIAAS